MTEVTPRLPYLDTARGLAAMSVITWHCYTAVINHPEASGLYTSPFHFFLYGEADMIFFFIHSGFILSYAHPDFAYKISGVSYLKFFIRRIFRIYPLFLIVLFISYLLRITIYPIPGTHYMSDHFMYFWSKIPRFTDVLKQGLLAIRIPDKPEYRLLPQDWTLTVEVLICPLVPLLNFLNGKIKLFSWLIVFADLKLFHMNTYLFEFAIGVNLFSYRRQIATIWNKTPLFLKSVCLVVAIPLYTCFFGYPNIFDSHSMIFSPAIDRLLVVAGCTLFFIFILNSVHIQQIFKHPLLVRIGKICYSLYVNHILLLICFSNIIMSALYQVIKGPKWLIILSFVLFFQVLTLGMSMLTYRIIEKPFNVMGKKLGDYFFQDFGKRRHNPVPPVS
jgi:peptidoglycan/LPS O-acetylase OafA/YrhL